MKLNLSVLFAIIQAAGEVFQAIVLLQAGDEAEQQFTVSLNGVKYDCHIAAKRRLSQGR